MKNEGSIQKYIIKYFIITIIGIGIAEWLINILQNNTLLLAVRLILFREYEMNKTMSSASVIGLMLLLILQVIFQSLNMKIMAARVRDAMVALVPSLEAYSQGTRSRGELLIIFLISLASIALYVLPYVIGIFLFAKKISKKVGQLNEERENERNLYHKRRNLMLSDIAHDLRTPITTVNGYAKALSDGLVTDPEKQQEYLEAIQKKSARMEDLIKLLFEYVKLDSDGFALDKSRDDICELLRENAAMIYSDIEEAGMEFDIDILEEDIQVEMDKIQISRVVTNLLVNAIRHNKAGTRIGLLARKRPGILIVDVADTGEVIPEDVKTTLFDPFAKGDKSRSNASGSGLGLSIAKKVVDMHGWELTLVEGPADFTKAFEIHIPLE